MNFLFLTSVIRFPYIDAHPLKHNRLMTYIHSPYMVH